MWFWAIFAVYAAGFILILVFHLMYLQMVTFPLALLRAVLWPLWIATGMPHGQPLGMD